MTDKSLNIVLGFDFGMKRIGVAVGQTITATARPLVTLKALSGTPRWQEVDTLISTWRPDALIVGVPYNMDGTVQPLTFEAEKFADCLRERYQLSVFGIDERLSTKDARERLFSQGGFKALQKGTVDQMAAQLILENWLMQTADNKRNQDE